MRRKVKPPVAVKLPGHLHPLVTDQPALQDSKVCSSCNKMIFGLRPYYCKDCDAAWHKECMPSSLEINHSCHPNHALKLLFDGAPDYTDGKCDLCREKLGEFVYHCSTCNFSLDVKCGKYPKCATINKPKCHNHPLKLMARQVSFVCNVCGMYGDRNPYVCVACYFMVHEDCANFPRVININRHDHRISHTYSLEPGNRKCGVCRMNVDWMYGAYSCGKCSDFFVHSTCATSHQVWDGRELEGIPEEKDDEPLFKVIEEKVINHANHPSHNLRLFTEDGAVCNESIRCELCQRPIYSDDFYKCMECDFVLHETCAYLPRGKRHSLSNDRILLRDGEGGIFKCHACHRFSSGYRYGIPYKNKELDLICATVDWSCDHECHRHTLFLTKLDYDTCGVCNSKHYVLRCVDCNFNMDYKCATIPKQIKHRCDDHPLVLCFGEKEQQHGTYWCEVCERKTDPKKWFYNCEECGIVCHTECVLGDFPNIKPGLRSTEDGIKHGVVRNNGVTRPHCRSCRTRCLVPFIYNISEDYYCSYACLKPFLHTFHYAFYF